MIPKIIHYCWFGGNPKPKLAEKCIKSWKKKCPDYEIIEWNEGNYDISTAPIYVRQAYEAKKWAFVTDYVRLQVVYENGGIYLDTDVELIKPLDNLLNNTAYFGLENKRINTGLGFGAEKGCKILQEIMESYNEILFLKDNGQYDKTPCPDKNTEIFLKHGFQNKDKKQMLDNGILILPMIYFCPIDFETNIKKKSFRTYSIHWFVASWHSPKEIEQIKKRQLLRRKQKRQERIDWMLHIPNRILIIILGKKYDELKRFFGK